MAEQDQEKTEQPTARRLEKAREEGNVAKSMDLTAALVLLAGVLIMALLGERIFFMMGHTVRAMIAGEHGANPTRPDDLMGMVNFGSVAVTHSLVPMLVILFGLGVVALILQVGLNITLKPLAPNLNKMNPITGVKRLFDARALMRLVMSLLKIILICIVVFIQIWIDMPWISHIGELDVAQAFAASAQLVFSLSIKLAVLLLILGLIDYIYQRWQTHQDLKMTKQEVKDEMKQMEGDPLTKQRRTRVARQLALQRLGQAVPNADVVVTNPTHFAIALKYDSATMRAPKVVAKGADFMALRIRQIAAAHGVPIVERKPLARALYANVEIGDEVPPEHYTAMAEILAYVYRLSDRNLQTAS